MRFSWRYSLDKNPSVIIVTACAGDVRAVSILIAESDAHPALELSVEPNAETNPRLPTAQEELQANPAAIPQVNSDTPASVPGSTVTTPADKAPSDACKRPDTQHVVLYTQIYSELERNTARTFFEGLAWQNISTPGIENVVTSAVRKGGARPEPWLNRRLSITWRPRLLVLSSLPMLFHLRRKRYSFPRIYQRYLVSLSSGCLLQNNAYVYRGITPNTRHLKGMAILVYQSWKKQAPEGACKV